MPGKIITVSQVHEGSDDVDVLIPHPLNIVADNLRVGRDHGTVETVVGPVKLLLLKADAGVEDCFHTLVEQRFNMTVDQFGRVADVLRGNGLHPPLKEVVVGPS